MADLEFEVSGRKRQRCNCATPPWRAEAELRTTAVLLEQMGDVAESLKKRENALEKWEAELTQRKSDIDDLQKQREERFKDLDAEAATREKALIERELSADALDKELLERELVLHARQNEVTIDMEYADHKYHEYKALEAALGQDVDRETLLRRVGGAFNEFVRKAHPLLIIIIHAPNPV